MFFFFSLHPSNILIDLGTLDYDANEPQAVQLGVIQIVDHPGIIKFNIFNFNIF